MSSSTFPPTVPPTVPGQAPDFIGRFRIKRLLGTGSMGTVYLAEDPVIHRQVAIKTLNLNVPAPEARLFEQTFLNEARSAGRLNHPHIVTVYDAGRINGMSYIAMEHLEGIELKQIIARGERLPVRQVCDIFIRVAEAIDYAHRQGIIHRDIKPANIFLIGKNNPKVLDFGIAQAMKSYSESVSGNPFDQRIVGTPNYMSPEMLQGKPLDGRTDVFSLGVVLYETLTGAVPFKGNKFEDLAHSILSTHPIPPHELNPEVSLTLARIVGKAIAKNPADRYATAKDMADDLRKYVKDERVRSLMSSTLETHEKRVESSRRWMIGSGLVALSLTAVAALLIYDRWVQPVISPSPEPPPPVATLPAANAPAPIAIAAAPIAPEAATTNSTGLQALNSTEPPVVETKRETATRSTIRDNARKAAAPVKAPPATASASTGTLNLAVSPWGEIIVDGVSRGISPPLSALTLSTGTHRIVIRNGDSEFATTVDIKADEPARLRHRF